MLQTISWTGYITLILLILAFYYIYLLIKWLPKKFQNLNFFKGKDSADEWTPAPKGVETKGAPLKNLSIEQLLVVDSRKLVQQAGKGKMPREDLLAALRKMVREDPWHIMREGPFKQILNNIIRLEAEIYCSIHLDDDELNGLWEK